MLKHKHYINNNYNIDEYQNLVDINLNLESEFIIDRKYYKLYIIHIIFSLIHFNKKAPEIFASIICDMYKLNNFDTNKIKQSIYKMSENNYSFWDCIFNRHKYIICKRVYAVYLEQFYDIVENFPLNNLICIYAYAYIKIKMLK